MGDNEEQLHAGTVISESLSQNGIVLGAVHAPRSDIPLVHVILRTEKASRPQLIASIGSLLRSSCQDIVVTPDVELWNEDQVIRHWIEGDSRFVVSTFESMAKIKGQHTMVLGAGTVLGTHSIAGLLESMEQTGATVMRVLVDGQRVAPEMWRTPELDCLRQKGDAEQLARRARTERWMSGDSLGMHDSSKPRPKQFLVKGAAGEPEMRLVVRDLNDLATRTDYEYQIRDLQSQLRRAQIMQRRAEGQGEWPPILTRTLAIMRRGPKYVVVKLREHTRGVAR